MEIKMSHNLAVLILAKIIMPIIKDTVIILIIIITITTTTTTTPIIITKTSIIKTTLEAIVVVVVEDRITTTTMPIKTTIKDITTTRNSTITRKWIITIITNSNHNSNMWTTLTTLLPLQLHKCMVTTWVVINQYMVFHFNMVGFQQLQVNNILVKLRHQLYQQSNHNKSRPLQLLK